MERIIVAGEALWKMRILTQPAEICDHSGQVLGTFCPTAAVACALESNPFPPQIAIEGNALRKLRRLNEPAEICDLHSQLIGKFFPSLEPSSLEVCQSESFKHSEGPSEDCASPKERTYTTAEVIAYLQSLP